MNNPTESPTAANLKGKGPFEGVQPLSIDDGPTIHASLLQRLLWPVSRPGIIGQQVTRRIFRQLELNRKRLFLLTVVQERYRQNTRHDTSLPVVHARMWLTSNPLLASLMISPAPPRNLPTVFGQPVSIDRASAGSSSTVVTSVTHIIHEHLHDASGPLPSLPPDSSPIPNRHEWVDRPAIEAATSQTKSTAPQLPAAAHPESQVGSALLATPALLEGLSATPPSQSTSFLAPAQFQRPVIPAAEPSFRPNQDEESEGLNANSPPAIVVISERSQPASPAVLPPAIVHNAAPRAAAPTARLKVEDDELGSSRRARPHGPNDGGTHITSTLPWSEKRSTSVELPTSEFGRSDARSEGPREFVEVGRPSGMAPIGTDAGSSQPSSRPGLRDPVNPDHMMPPIYLNNRARISPSGEGSSHPPLTMASNSPVQVPAAFRRPVSTPNDRSESKELGSSRWTMKQPDFQPSRPDSTSESTPRSARVNLGAVPSVIHSGTTVATSSPAHRLEPSDAVAPYRKLTQALNSDLPVVPPRKVTTASSHGLRVVPTLPSRISSASSRSSALESLGNTEVTSAGISVSPIPAGVSASDSPLANLPGSPSGHPTRPFNRTLEHDNHDNAFVLPTVKPIGSSDKPLHERQSAPLTHSGLEIQSSPSSGASSAGVAAGNSPAGSVSSGQAPASFSDAKPIPPLSPASSRLPSPKSGRENEIRSTEQSSRRISVRDLDLNELVDHIQRRLQRQAISERERRGWSA